MYIVSHFLAQSCENARAELSIAGVADVNPEVPFRIGAAGKRYGQTSVRLRNGGAVRGQVGCRRERKEWFVKSGYTSARHKASRDGRTGHKLPSRRDRLEFLP